DAGDLAVVLGGTVLGADLHDPLVLPRRLHNGAALADVVRQRLLYVDVLARLAGQDRGNGVPVVRRGDDHRVHVLAVEHLAEVAVRLAARAGPLPGLGRVRLVDVAHGHERDVRDRARQSRHGQAARAAADQPDVYALVGAEDPAGGSGGSRGRRLK